MDLLIISYFFKLLTANLKYLILFFLIIFSVKSISQDTSNIDSDSLSPGVFKLVLSADKTKVKDGDEVEIDVQITGFGNIDFESAKIFLTTNSDFLNTRESYIKGGFYSEKIKKTGKMVFGSPKMPLANGGTIIYPYSRFVQNDKIISLFSKTLETKEHSIYFEQKYWSDSESRTIPALFYHFQLRDDLPSGNYYLTYVFTYFNGIDWVNDTEVIEIEVMPWYVEHESKIQIVAIIIAFLTIATLIRPVFKEIILLLKMIRKQIFRILKKFNKL